MSDIQKLQANVAVLKTAPMFGKAAQAERVIDSLIEIIVDQNRRIEILEGVQKNGKS